MAFRWLRETRKLQTDTFDVDPMTLEGGALADFIVWNHTAAVDELCEFLGETQWKPWQTNRGECNKDLAIDELVDVCHFIGNLAVAMGCTDAEWTRRYRKKLQINRKRQQGNDDRQIKKLRKRVHEQP